MMTIRRGLTFFWTAFFVWCLLSCGEGSLTSLHDHRHQVAATCGPAIAAALTSHQPVVILGPDGQAVNSYTVFIEPIRYALGAWDSTVRITGHSAAPPNGQPLDILRSEHCVAVPRGFQGQLSVLTPESIGASMGAAKEQGRSLGAVWLPGDSRLQLAPLRTSRADFRRCGHPPSEDRATGELQRALMIWPKGAPTDTPPRLRHLAFFYKPIDNDPSKSSAATRLRPNARGCLFYSEVQSGGRLTVHNSQSVPVAHRPLRMTRRGDLPLVLCPKSKAEAQQIAQPHEPCRSGFLTTCELALADRLRPALGAWLRSIADVQKTRDCGEIYEWLRVAGVADVTSYGKAPIDLEILRYAPPELRSLTISAKRGIGYLPTIASLVQLSIDQSIRPRPLFAEPQPQLAKLRIKGGKVPLSDLPLPQLTELTLDGVGLTSLAGIEEAKVLFHLAIPRNAVVAVDPLTDLPQLRGLDIADNGITELEPLTRTPKALKELLVAGNPQLDMSILPELTSLERLDVGRNGLASIDAFAPLIHLKKLDITGNAIEDIGVVERMPELASFMASNNQIRSLAPLARLVRLQHVILSYNRITDLRPLRELPVVHEFVFDENPLGTTQKKSTDNCPVDARSLAIRAFCSRLFE